MMFVVVLDQKLFLIQLSYLCKKKKKKRLISLSWSPNRITCKCKDMWAFLMLGWWSYFFLVWMKKVRNSSTWPVCRYHSWTLSALHSESIPHHICSPETAQKLENIAVY